MNVARVNFSYVYIYTCKRFVARVARVKRESLHV